MFEFHFMSFLQIERKKLGIYNYKSHENLQCVILM